jgi:hypothetical protein
MYGSDNRTSTYEYILCFSLYVWRHTLHLSMHVDDPRFVSGKGTGDTNQEAVSKPTQQKRITKPSPQAVIKAKKSLTPVMMTFMQ